MDAELIKTKKEELKKLERKIANYPYQAGDKGRLELQSQWQHTHREFLYLLKEDARKFEADQVLKRAEAEAVQKAQIQKQLEEAVASSNKLGSDPEVKVAAETEGAPILKTKPRTKTKS